MLMLRDIKKVAVRSKPPMLAGQKVWRKYRQASIRLSEYRKLKAMVPSIAKKRRVSKVRVVEEAIKYIDELHTALFRRAPLLAGRYGTDLPSTVDEPQQFVARLLANSIASPSTGVSPVTSSTGVPGVPAVTSSSAVTSRKLASIPTRPLQSSNCINRRNL